MSPSLSSLLSTSSTKNSSGVRSWINISKFSANNSPTRNSCLSTLRSLLSLLKGSALEPCRLCAFSLMVFWKTKSLVSMGWAATNSWPTNLLPDWPKQESFKHQREKPKIKLSWKDKEEPVIQSLKVKTMIDQSVNEWFLIRSCISFLRQ